jgi:hypothetical protein
LAALIHDLDAQSVVPTRIIGSGVGPYREQIPEALLSSAVACEGPTAAGLWHSSVAALLEGPALPPERLQAIYLRRSYAEMGIHRPKRTWPKSPFV